MNKTYIASGIGLLVVIVAGVIALQTPARQPQRQQPAQQQPTTGVVSTTATIETPSKPVTAGQQPSGSDAFTLEQVAQHKTPDDCWTVVRGVVYDVTDWIAKHPGGERAITRMCGVDATGEFTEQHEGERRPESMLASFKIGNIK